MELWLCDGGVCLCGVGLVLCVRLCVGLCVGCGECMGFGVSVGECVCGWWCLGVCVWACVWVCVCVCWGVCLFVESQMCHTIIGIGPAPEWEDIHLFVKDTTTA